MKRMANTASMRWPGFLFLSCCIAGLLAGGGCGSADKESEPVVIVEVTPAKRAAIEETISAEAVVFPVQQAVVMPKITSTIKTFLVQRGSKVRKGQVLAVLENADLSAAAEQSRGDFEQAEANYTTTTGASLPQQIQKAELDATAAKTAFDAQQKILDSRKELFQQGALPRRDLDAAEVALAQARTQSDVARKQLADLQQLGEKQALKSASGQLMSARGKYQGAAAQLSYSEIRSPIDGVVTDRPQYAGELASANLPLLTVMDTSRLIAKAHVAQSEAAQLKPGNDARIRLPGADEPIEGRVSLVSPALDTGSTTVEIWVEAKKKNSALRPGMTVHLAVTGRSSKSAVVIPAVALFKNDEGDDYVVLAGSDNHAKVTKVHIGIRNSKMAEIAEGVKEGDPVITSGGYALPDKTQIKVQSPGKGGGESAGDAQSGSAEKGQE